MQEQIAHYEAVVCSEENVQWNLVWLLPDFPDWNPERCWMVLHEWETESSF